MTRGANVAAVDAKMLVDASKTEKREVEVVDKAFYDDQSLPHSKYGSPLDRAFCCITKKQQFPFDLSLEIQSCQTSDHASPLLCVIICMHSAFNGSDSGSRIIARRTKR